MVIEAGAKDGLIKIYGAPLIFTLELAIPLGLIETT
jgi:hypothetical protein